MSKRGVRWYIDPVTGIANIRRHPDAREYLPPDLVKRMVVGREDEDTCPVCAQPLPTGIDDSNGEHQHDQ